MVKKRLHKCMHLDYSHPRDAVAASHGTKKVRVVIPDFIGNNRLGWTNCMGSH